MLHGHLRVERFSASYLLLVLFLFSPLPCNTCAGPVLGRPTVPRADRSRICRAGMGGVRTHGHAAVPLAPTRARPFWAASKAAPGGPPEPTEHSQVQPRSKGRVKLGSGLFSCPPAKAPRFLVHEQPGQCSLLSDMLHKAPGHTGALTV